MIAIFVFIRIILVCVGLAFLWDPSIGSNDIFWGILVLYFSTWFKVTTWD